MRALILAIALVLAAGSAGAHAFLDHAQPRVGARVAVSPREVRLWFSEKLEPAFSRLTLVDAAGHPVAAGPARVDSADPRQLVLVLARPLPPGRYKVLWRAVSTDTHATQGSFEFQVVA